MKTPTCWCGEPAIHYDPTTGDYLCEDDMSNYSERRDDHCPACGEDIDWEDGWHELWPHEQVTCLNARAVYDVAVLDLAHLND